LQARKLGVRVTLQGVQDAPDVHVDRTMVEQVLLNLARNGIQAMQGTPMAERVLTIRVRHGGGAAPWLEFAVLDCGAGIEEEIAKQLFTPFFSTKADGMGLGLSLCRTVIEQHGGLLRFEAHAPRGTAFVFTLPVANPVSVEITDAPALASVADSVP